jgi:stage II sporulation protein D
MKAAPSFFLLFFMLPLAALSSENIRVAVLDNQKSITVQSERGLVLEGMRPGRREKTMIFSTSYGGTRPARVRSEGEFTRLNGADYRGWIEIRRKKNGLLLVVNDLGMEDYLMGVVAEEIPFDWEFDALKAQAVASRTYALYRKRNSGKRPYHILATVKGQVYSGRRGERASAVRAVRETEGLVLAYNGEVIPAFYHSSCGGHTEDAFETWGIDAPYLKGVDCGCQEISKYGVWEKRFTLKSIALSLGKLGYRLKDISGLDIGSITAAGRVREVALKHAGGTTNLPAETLRQALGYSRIPSVFFEPMASGAEVVFSGRGLGHGVGLCQWGAKEMAQKGFDFKAILNRYYPGTELARMDEL